MDSPRCATHPGIPAAFSCARCGTFACGPCGVWLVEDTRGTRTRVCLRCREVEIARLRAAATHGSKRATAAFVVSLVFCLTPLAWAALPLGLLELRAIRRGDAPRAGRPWAAAGAAAGALSLLLWVFYAFAFARFR